VLLRLPPAAVVLKAAFRLPVHGGGVPDAGRVIMRSANGSYSRLRAIRFEIQILQDGTHNTPYSPSSILDFFYACAERGFVH